MTKLTYSIPFLLLSFLFCSLEKMQTNNELFIAFSSDPATIDPVFTTDLASRKLNKLLFATLFRTDSNGNMENGLVEKAHWNKTTKTLTITLKAEKNHLGALLSAEDVLFSLQRLQTENGPRKSSLQFIKTIRPISANSLEIRVASGLYKTMIALSLPHTAIYSKAQYLQNHQYISWSNYYLKEWNKNNYIKLVSPRPGFPQNLTIRILPGSSTALYLFGKQQLDIMPLPFFLLNHKLVTQGKVVSVKGQSVQYIAINNGNDCFDSYFRKSLNHAIDRKTVIQYLFDSYAIPTQGALPAIYLDNFFQPYPYNRSKAVALLKKSKCYPSIASTTLDLRMRSDDINQAVGRTILKYLGDIGLTARIRFMEKTAIYRENNEKKGGLTLFSWYLDYNSPLNFIDPLFYSAKQGNGGNRAFYNNPLVDQMIEETEYMDHKESLDNIKNINRKITEDAPWIFLWSIHDNYLISKKAQQYPLLIKNLLY